MVQYGPCIIRRPSGISVALVCLPQQYFSTSMPVKHLQLPVGLALYLVGLGVGLALQLAGLALRLALELLGFALCGTGERSCLTLGLALGLGDSLLDGLGNLFCVDCQRSSLYIKVQWTTRLCHVCNWNQPTSQSGDVNGKLGIWLLTALLNACYGGTRNCPVDSLCGILDGLDGALARDGGGAEQASLAGNLGAEHDGGDVWKGWF
jgi:hypothetical protein